MVELMRRSSNAEDRSRSGMTLVELLLAGVLLAVVFLGVSSSYTSFLKLFQNLQANVGVIPGTAKSYDANYAMEHMTKRIHLANKAVISGTGQLKLRLDYDGGSLAPKGTVSDTTDDVWVKYAFLSYTPAGGTEQKGLFWKTSAAETGDVSDTDAELQPGLKIKTSITSQFSRTGDPGYVRIQFAAAVGSPEIAYRMDGGAAPREMTKET